MDSEELPKERAQLGNVTLFMPAGRPRLHPNQAEKQFAYRQRKNEQQFEERQLAERVKGLLEVATSRGFVLNASAPTWAQLDELAEWLKTH